MANSDSEEDQALKLKVRDKVISYLKPKLEDSESISQSEKIILNEKDKLMDICKETIKQNGYNYDVSCLLYTSRTNKGCKSDYDCFKSILYRPRVCHKGIKRIV